MFEIICIVSTCNRLPSTLKTITAVSSDTFNGCVWLFWMSMNTLSIYTWIRSARLAIIYYVFYIPLIFANLQIPSLPSVTPLSLSPITFALEKRKGQPPPYPNCMTEFMNSPYLMLKLRKKKLFSFEVILIPMLWCVKQITTNLQISKVI